MTFIQYIYINCISIVDYKHNFCLLWLLFGLLSPGTLLAQKDKDRVEKDEDKALIDEGKDLVLMDFPEPTDIKDIIKAVAKWTGKNVILDRQVSGKIQIVSPKKITKAEAYQAFLSALNMLGLTTVQTGKIIKILKVRPAQKSNVRIYPGATWAPNTDAIITQIVPLKYVDAKKVSSTLSKLVQPNAIVAYEPTNTLIITDTGYQIGRALDILREIDVQTQQPKMIIVPIIHSDPKSVASKVQEILKGSSGGSRSSNTYNSFKIIIDERTNSIIVFGPPRTIKDIRELVKKFDMPISDPASEATIRVRALNYADASKLASTLSSLASASKSSSKTRGSRGVSSSSISSLGEGVKITSDEATNSLIITGSRSAYNALNKIIQQLDKRRSQVYVEADVLDLNETDEFSSGMSLFFGQQAGGDKGPKGIIGWQGGAIGKLISASALQNNSGTNSLSTEVLSQVVKSFSEHMSIGILSGRSVEVSGLGKITPGALIKLIKNDGNSRSITSPQILTSNNQEAVITVGKKVSFTTQSMNSTTGAIATSVQSENVDTTLSIKPNISYSGYITLDLNIDSSSVISTNREGIPQLAKRKTKQLVTVKNGQTIVLSGLFQTHEIKSSKKVPLLGDIPILGWLFKNTNINKARTNLVIFITPHIVHGGADLAAIYEKKVIERDQFLRSVYGTKDEKFNRLIPQLEHGIYKPSEFDKIEEERSEQHNKLMLEDAGFIEKKKSEPIKEVEQTVPVELLPGNIEQQEVESIPVESDELTEDEGYDTDKE